MIPSESNHYLITSSASFEREADLSLCDRSKDDDIPGSSKCQRLEAHGIFPRSREHAFKLTHGTLAFRLVRGVPYLVYLSTPQLNLTVIIFHLSLVVPQWLQFVALGCFPILVGRLPAKKKQHLPMDACALSIPANVKVSNHADSASSRSIMEMTIRLFLTTHSFVSGIQET